MSNSKSSLLSVSSYVVLLCRLEEHFDDQCEAAIAQLQSHEAALEALQQVSCLPTVLAATAGMLGGWLIRNDQYLSAMMSTQG